MEYLFIYCLQIFENIENLSVMFIVIGVLALFVAVALYFALEYDKVSDYCSKDIIPFYDKIQRLCKIVPTILLTLGIIISFLPTRQTLLLMGGMYLGKKAFNTIVTDEKLKKVDTIINLELDKYIKQLKEGK